MPTTVDDLPATHYDPESGDAFRVGRHGLLFRRSEFKGWRRTNFDRALLITTAERDREIEERKGRTF